MDTPLHDLAATNQPGLRGRFTAQAASLPDLAAVSAHIVTKGRISVNMRPQLLLSFLDTGVRLNIFERAAQLASSSLRPLEEVLQGLLGKWYRRRVNFETALGGGHRFHYGALNTGGLGAPRYGALCAIFASSPAHEPAWVEEDSLKGPWWESDDKLEPGRLGPSTALHEDVGALAALKLCAAGVPGHHDTWPECLCADDKYVESLTISAPELPMLVEVRVSEDYAEQLESAALASRRGPIPIDSLLDFDNYRRLRTGLEARLVPWVEVSV